MKDHKPFLDLKEQIVRKKNTRGSFIINGHSCNGYACAEQIGLEFIETNKIYEALQKKIDIHSDNVKSIIVHCHTSKSPCGTCCTSFARECEEGGVFNRLAAGKSVTFINTTSSVYQRPIGQIKIDATLAGLEEGPIRIQLLPGASNLPYSTIVFCETNKDSINYEIKKMPPRLDIPHEEDMFLKYNAIFNKYLLSINGSNINHDGSLVKHYTFISNIDLSECVFCIETHTKLFDYFQNPLCCLKKINLTNTKNTDLFIEKVFTSTRRHFYSLTNIMVNKSEITTKSLSILSDHFNAYETVVRDDVEGADQQQPKFISLDINSDNPDIRKYINNSKLIKDKICVSCRNYPRTLIGVDFHFNYKGEP